MLTKTKYMWSLHRKWAELKKHHVFPNLPPQLQPPSNLHCWKCSILAESCVYHVWHSGPCFYSQKWITSCQATNRVITVAAQSWKLVGSYCWHSVTGVLCNLHFCVGLGVCIIPTLCLFVICMKCSCILIVCSCILMYVSTPLLLTGSLLQRYLWTCGWQGHNPQFGDLVYQLLKVICILISVYA